MNATDYPNVTTDAPPPERDEFKDYDVTVRATIAQMVETYRYERGRIERAYLVLWESEQKLEHVFGKEFSDFDTFPDRAHHDEDSHKAVLNKLKCSAWRAIVNRLKIHKLLSPSEWEKLSLKLDDHKQLPELTIAEVADMLTAYQQNAAKYLQQAIVEVYQYLRPHDGYSEAKYKTNQKNAHYELGKKIILTRIVDTSFGCWRVNYGHTSQKLVSLDMVFTHLAGEAVPDGYQSPLVDAINCTEAQSGKPVETNFFRVKAYLNGNVHLEFKRLDLLAKFNAVADRE